MYFEKVSFGGADLVLKRKGSAQAEIEKILQDLNTTVTWHGQTALNKGLDTLFRGYQSWQLQFDSSLKLETGRERSGEKSIDYRNVSQKIDVEAEFGNVASFYRDIFKFNIAKGAGQIDVGIIVVGNKQIANTMGENIASYERFKDELSISWKYGANADCPVLVFGLHPLSYPGKKSLIDPNAQQLREEVIGKRARRSRSARLAGRSDQSMLS